MTLIQNGHKPQREASIVVMAALALIYFAAGKLGLSMAVIQANASAVWAPSGIAVAAFLIYGPRLCPAILLGVFLPNIFPEGTLLVCLGIAGENVLEGLVAAFLLRLFGNGQGPFDSPAYIFKFAL